MFSSFTTMEARWMEMKSIDLPEVHTLMDGRMGYTFGALAVTASALLTKSIWCKVKFTRILSTFNMSNNANANPNPNPNDELDEVKDENIYCADDVEFHAGVDKRPDIENVPGTSAKNPTTLSILRFPPVLTCIALMQFISLKKVANFVMRAAANVAILPHAKEAVQFLARINAKAKNKALPQTILDYLPDSAATSLRRSKFSSIVPLLPSGYHSNFFSEWYEIRTYEDHGIMDTLDDATKGIWKYHAEYVEFVKKLGTGTKPATQAQLVAGMAQKKKEVYGTAHRPRPIATAGAKRTASAANFVSPSDGEFLQQMEQAKKKSIYSAWAHQRDQMELKLANARAVMYDSTTPPETRAAAERVFTKWTTKLNAHLLTEPDSSGGPAAAPGGAVPPPPPVGSGASTSNTRSTSTSTNRRLHLGSSSKADQMKEFLKTFPESD